MSGCCGGNHNMHKHDNNSNEGNGTNVISFLIVLLIIGGLIYYLVK